MGEGGEGAPEGSMPLQCHDKAGRNLAYSGVDCRIIMAVTRLCVSCCDIHSAEGSQSLDHNSTAVFDFVHRLNADVRRSKFVVR